MLRATVATLVVIGLGATAHEMAGGGSLQVVPALILAVLVGPLVWLVVRGRTSLPRMLLATGAGQGVTHLVLAGMAPSTGGAAPRLHVHEAMAPMFSTTGAPGPSVSAHGSMLVAHVVATLVASVLLTRGADVVRSLARRLLLPVSGSVPVPHPGPLPVAPVEVRIPDGRRVGPVGGRAPPLQLV
ncbi:hypothetical protein G7075_13435 [Phycicoccus sp. HDW14]|uniref:hypothetical protein n=1 Tax=Phycicoccus sp. HDW14 TaxID=2714941 RepID=UPI00140BCA0C|nr:hypothetical protein [Phycicoccus sp. HDW14]QIM21892.1 hypothetical protein G7075_13435 [Phycicoccus sp. HDW14]